MFIKFTRLIPLRFIALLTHLITAIVLIYDRDPSIYNAIQADDEYSSRNVQYIIALALTIGLVVLEMGSFMAGVSMFMPSQTLISIACHVPGTFAGALFCIDAWPSTDYWIIFGLCAVPPFLSEIATALRVLIYKPGVVAADKSRVK